MIAGAPPHSAATNLERNVVEADLGIEFLKPHMFVVRVGADTQCLVVADDFRLGTQCQGISELHPAADIGLDLRAVGIILTATVLTETDGSFPHEEGIRLDLDTVTIANRSGPLCRTSTQHSEIRGWVELTDALALSAQPKVVSNEKVLGIGANANDKHVWFQELNAKLSVFNIAFEVGRGSLWWGPGYHGSLLLTDHAFPLDMVRVGSDEPFQLPWILEPLGDWKVNSFLARLERDRDFPRANVFGLRLSYLPKSWLELGFTRLTQFLLVADDFRLGRFCIA